MLKSFTCIGFCIKVCRTKSLVSASVCTQNGYVFVRMPNFFASKSIFVSASSVAGKNKFPSYSFQPFEFCVPKMTHQPQCLHSPWNVLAGQHCFTISSAQCTVHLISEITPTKYGVPCVRESSRGNEHAESGELDKHLHRFSFSDGGNFLYRDEWKFKIGSQIR